MNVFFATRQLLSLQHTNKDGLEKIGTIKVIKIFLNFWKIENMKGCNAIVHFSNPLKTVVTSDSDR